MKLWQVEQYVLIIGGEWGHGLEGQHLCWRGLPWNPDSVHYGFLKIQCDLC